MESVRVLRWNFQRHKGTVLATTKATATRETDSPSDGPSLTPVSVLYCLHFSPGQSDMSATTRVALPPWRTLRPRPRRDVDLNVPPEDGMDAVHQILIASTARRKLAQLPSSSSYRLPPATATPPCLLPLNTMSMVIFAYFVIRQFSFIHVFQFVPSHSGCFINRYLDSIRQRVQ
jgi:hypothetical protein